VRTVQPRGDVTKLPKWAQTYISNLNSQIESLGGSLTAVSSEHPKSNVVMQGRHISDPDITLPPNSSIYFYMDDSSDRLMNMVEVRHSDKHILLVRASGVSLAIRPVAGNTIQLEMDKR
jgi:hypothetical protein